MAISMDCLGTPEYMYYCKYTCIIPGLVYHGFILELLIIAPHQPPPPPPAWRHSGEEHAHKRECMRSRCVYC